MHQRIWEAIDFRDACNCRYMKLLFIAALLFFLVPSAFYAQEIPKGVRYKKATDEVNNSAKELIVLALTKETRDLDVDATFGKGAIMCGPFLWALVGDVNSFKGATPVNLHVDASVFQGRGITKEDQKRLLWERLTNKLKGSGAAIIRKANTAEISFYWAMIPFDIEEPLLIADFGNYKLLANFAVKDGKPRIFWLDLVQDLKKLK